MPTGREYRGPAPAAGYEQPRKLDLPVSLAQGVSVSTLNPLPPAGTPVLRLGPPLSLPLANQNATIATPASGRSDIFAHMVGGRPHLKIIDQFGHDYSMQEDLFRNKVGFWVPVDGAASGNSVGLRGWASVGTPTLRTASIASPFQKVTRLAWVSATSGAGAIAEARIAQNTWTAGTGSALGFGGFKVGWRFAITDGLSGGKFFAGMSTAAGTNVEQNTLTNAIGIAALSTDNTQFYIVYGGTTAQTAIPVGTTLGAPTNTTTWWELVITSPPGGTNLFFLTFTNLSTGAVFSTYTSAPIVASPAAATVPINTVGLAPRITRITPSTTAAVFELSNFAISTDT